MSYIDLYILQNVPSSNINRDDRKAIGVRYSQSADGMAGETCNPKWIHRFAGGMWSGITGNPAPERTFRTQWDGRYIGYRCIRGAIRGN